MVSLPLTVALIVAIGLSGTAAASNRAGGTPADAPATAEIVAYRDVTTPSDMSLPTDGTASGTTGEGEASGGSPYAYDVPSDDATLGDEIAWLAVQMAGVATPMYNVPGVSLYAPGADPWKKIDDPRLANCFAIMDATLGAYGGNNAYGSCNQAACGVLAAVVDMDMIPHNAASGDPSHMLAYLSAHPETWERVDATCTDDLLPGDVLVHSGHTAIWVGNKMAQTKFPGTSCSVYQAGYQPGHHARYPELNDGGYANGYNVFRARRRNTEAQFPPIDYRAIIAKTQAGM